MSSAISEVGDFAARFGDRLLRNKVGQQQATIMIVDDEPINIKIARKYLRDAGFCKFITSDDSRQAMDLIRSEQPDVVLLDIVMPHVTGLNILEVIRGDRQLAHLPVLILTASADDDTKRQALEMGATDFLQKPVNPTELIARVRNSVLLKAHFDQISAYSRRLELEVQERTRELAESREEVIHVLACAAEHRDQETANHVLRVGRYVGVIARQLGMTEERCQLLEQAAILHDVGKIGIPDSLLRKPDKLTDEEMDEMRQHCQYGLNILFGVPGNGCESLLTDNAPKSPILTTAATIAVSHHERWDSCGYPAQLGGDEIPIEGRITAVADVFDALSSRRPYKEPMPINDCFAIIQRDAGSHFDPEVVTAFLNCRAQVETIARELAD